MIMYICDIDFSNEVGEISEKVIFDDHSYISNFEINESARATYGYEVLTLDYAYKFDINYK